LCGWKSISDQTEGGLSIGYVPVEPAPRLTNARPVRWVVVVGVLWMGLLVVAIGKGSWLDTAWPGWSRAFWAAAVWGVNGLLLRYGIGPPFEVGRVPVLSLTFALLMTVFGCASYWATVQLYPEYRVEIERAALLVAVCTALSLVTATALLRLPNAGTGRYAQWFVWNWSRLTAVTYLLFLVAVVGTVLAIKRIGYIPILSGDPESLRIEFPTIGGIWYRLSMLGGVVALLAGIQVCARRASLGLWGIGLISLAMVGLYGPRFFVVLPLGAIVLIWDRVRGRIPWPALGLSFTIVVPVLAALFFVRQRDPEPLAVLGPVGLVLYGTLGEFRDLGWVLDHYEDPARLQHGETMGSVIVPILPTVAWAALGIDKDAIFARNSANILADEMGRDTGQRVGIYGELYMNFGWAGAMVGASLYGLLLGYLDRRFRHLRETGAVSASLVGLAAATTIFAQIGQLNMFTATLVSYGYPILGVAFIAARRVPRVA